MKRGLPPGTVNVYNHTIKGAPRSCYGFACPGSDEGHVVVRRIRNPILPGFNPDPSICRVGDDYYIATSTFEWYPGIRIYHSRDLCHWQLVSRPLNREGLLNMVGNPDSGGVWAPCLSWSDGLFYLLFTDVKRLDGSFKDTHNYLTTCEFIDGEWAEPVYLNSSGFDPSIFHDDDGRKWYVNMVWDHRPDRSRFAGIVLQEYSPERKVLLGERKLIFEGSGLDCTEGPHLYKRDGYYYLITAEGGTGYEHSVTMARSRSIGGPYELDPSGPVLTSSHDPEWPLQRAGHADLVETQQGEMYMVHLVSRPLPGTRLSPLGRETAIQKLEYTGDGWFRLSQGHVLPQLEVDAPDLARSEVAPEIEHDDFDETKLNPVYQWLRTPWPEEFMSLRDSPGSLRLYGMESPGSRFRQALVARRQTAFKVEATTRVQFYPDSFQQLAGLILYYNSTKFHYLYISSDQAIGRHIGMMSCEANPKLHVEYPTKDELVALPDTGDIYLRANVEGAKLVFSWSLEGEAWSELPVALEMGLLSDECGVDDRVDFTGTFIGLCCNDITGARCHADFEFFSVRSQS